VDQREVQARLVDVVEQISSEATLFAGKFAGGATNPAPVMNATLPASLGIDPSFSTANSKIARGRRFTCGIFSVPGGS
jgi:hypothetical protein